MSEGSGSKIQITVAIIGVVGVLGTAIFANWDKIFPPVQIVAVNPPAATPNPVDDPSSGSPVEQAPATINELRREAEIIAAQYFEAMQTSDLESLMRLSKPPFFLDQEVGLTASALRQGYTDAIDQRRERPRDPLTVSRLLSGTIGDLKAQGTISSNDRMLRAMNLKDDDLVVAMFFKVRDSEEGVAFYFRRLSNSVELAGLWD
ncbi:MAG: hypothetical protein O2910_06830 [Proteobacteria bacterium]|nr:hypothetical protein [Pseudomonadota bacterium]